MEHVSGWFEDEENASGELLRKTKRGEMMERSGQEQSAIRRENHEVFHGKAGMSNQKCT